MNAIFHIQKTDRMYVKYEYRGCTASSKLSPANSHYPESDGANICPK